MNYLKDECRRNTREKIYSILILLFSIFANISFNEESDSFQEYEPSLDY